MNIGRRLEQYSIKRPQFVLIVTAEIDGELDEIAIYKGFSSSLVRPTAFSPDVPVLPDGAKIVAIALLASPYNPEQPNYIEQNLTWDTIQPLLSEAGV